MIQQKGSSLDSDVEPDKRRRDKVGKGKFIAPHPSEMGPSFAKRIIKEVVVGTVYVLAFLPPAECLKGES